MDSPSILGSLQATLPVWHVRDRGDKDLSSSDQKATKLQAALDVEVDGFLMGLQRTDAPLGPPIERFKYPHFFLSTGQHFNSRGARAIARGGPRLYLLFTSFLVLYPVELCSERVLVG